MHTNIYYYLYVNSKKFPINNSLKLTSYKYIKKTGILRHKSYAFEMINLKIRATICIRSVYYLIFVVSDLKIVLLTKTYEYIEKCFS